MLATDAAALHDRIDKLSASVKEDFRSLGDDILKLQETADHHTTILAELTKGQAGLTKGQAGLIQELAEVRADQAAIHQRLDGHAMQLNGLELSSSKQAAVLGQHTEMLSELLERLPPRAS